jgi:hypothetical protein
MALAVNYTPQQIFDSVSPPIYCRWVACWNPVLFSYTRKDVLVSSITGSSGNARINLATAPSVRPVAGDKVYVYVEGKFDGVYSVLSSPTADSIVISASDGGSFTIGGYVNLLTTRSNYYIELIIRDQSNALVATVRYTPSVNGLIEADIAGILQSKVENDDDYDTTTGGQQRNGNAYFQFKVSTKEYWDGSSESVVNNGNDWFAVNGAFQIGHPFNGNYADYFINDFSKTGKFLSPFVIPTAYPNYPVVAQFIYDEDALPDDLEIATFTNYGNAVPALPPDNDATGNTDLSNTLENGIASFVFPLGGISGTDNRRNVYVWLQKKSDHVRVSEQKMYKIKPVDQQACNSVFLRWLAPDGSYAQYLFEGNYRETQQVESNGTYQKAFNRIDTLKGFSRYLKKTGFSKFQIGMTGLDQNDADGIRTLLNSPMVYRITPNASTGFFDVVEVLVEPGTFAIKQAKSDLFDVEFSIVFPEIFNQGA